MTSSTSAGIHFLNGAVADQRVDIIPKPGPVRGPPGFRLAGGAGDEPAFGQLMEGMRRRAGCGLLIPPLGGGGILVIGEALPGLEVTIASIPDGDLGVAPKG